MQCLNMSDMTLLDLSIARTALLLRDSYYPVGCYSSEIYEEHNPFIALPSHIIEDLVTAVIQLTPSGTLSVKQLYLLLSSGRIKNFILEGVLLPTEEFVGILTALCVQGMKLKKLVLQKIYCLETPDDKYMSMKSTAIECLLSMSPNLEHIVIDKVFDLKAIQNIHCLKYLELNFVPKNKLFDLIPKIDDYTFVPNETLSHLYVFEDCRHQISAEELAFLLQYCPQLSCIKNNLVCPLSLLHSEELFRGSVTTQYKLQKYILGSVFVNPNEGGAASASVIHIAALTCPQTRELDVLVNEHQAIAALADFKNLTSFLIQWEKTLSADFRLGLQSVLTSIGSQLKDLTIANFNNIDFEIIGKYCPSIKELRIECDSETVTNVVDETYFKNLTGMHLQCENSTGIKSNTLMILLGNCDGLTSLCLDNIFSFTDELLDSLLQKNRLTNLKDVLLLCSSLTERGIAHLVTQCTSLEYFRFNSTIVSFDTAAQIVHDINPFVIVSTTD